MNKKRKAELLLKLSRSFSAFYPAMANRFACPTCLPNFPTSASAQASEAHIVPQSAGGKASTILCRDCNSQFGARQDKWFGEQLHLRENKLPILATRYQSGSILIEGVKVGGKVVVETDGTINFSLHTKHTAPKALQHVLNLAASSEIREISLDPPILKNAWLIPFGYLTAAYLLWFSELGYSFALQRHLDAVRSLILSPARGKLPRNAIFQCVDKYFDTPWIGIGAIHGKTALLAGLADRIVLLPSYSSPDLYEVVDSLPDNCVLTDYEVVQFYEDHQFGSAMSVMYRSAQVVLPDIAFRGGKMPERMLRFPGDGVPAQELTPITKDQATQAMQQPGAEYARVVVNNSLPATGESGEA